MRNERFTLTVKVVIRPCRRKDLATLEWFGLFIPHRRLIRTVFAEHQRGESFMLVAEVNGVASGQIWIDLASGRNSGVGFLWALRVFPCLQNLGLGTRLIEAAEEVLAERGFTAAELTVERDNTRALALYLRRGYVQIDQCIPLLRDPVAATTSQVALRKPLRVSERLVSEDHPTPDLIET